MGAEDRIQEKLPHYDRGKPKIRAFLRPGAEAIDELDNVANALRDALYLDTATGHALDQLGARWGVVRNPGEPDSRYRQRIRLEIRMCLSSATIDQIKAMLGEYMGWDPRAIRISNNWSPTLRAEFPAFFEVRIPMSWLSRQVNQFFRFSSHPTQSTYQSDLGFDTGPMASFDPGRLYEYPLTADELLDRLAGVGIKFLLGTYGGFRFSNHPTESTLNSELGFDRGQLVGILHKGEGGK